MFKKITYIMAIILISGALLVPTVSFAQGRGGRGGGGRGGFGGGGMMGGFGDAGMQRGGFPQQTTAIDVNSFRESTLLTYLADANGNSVDPTTLSEEQLQGLYTQIGRSNRDVIDISRFDEFTQVRNTVMGQGTDPNEEISVNLNGLTINSIIEILIQWTGKAVLPSNEALDLRLTVFSPSKMKRSDALNLLYSAMRQQGFVAETRNNIIYIMPASQSKIPFADMLGPDDSLLGYPDNQTVVRKIFRLKHYTASTMGQLITPFLNPTADVVAEETSQTLMVTDTVEMLLQVDKIIKQYDKELSGTVTQLLEVKHSDPAELADMISMIMANNLSSSGTLGGFNMGGMMGGMPQQGRTNTRNTNTRTTNTRGNDRGRTTNDRGRTANNPTSMMGMGMFGAAASASATTIGTTKPEPQLIPDSVNKIIIATATPTDMVTIKKLLNELDTQTQVVWNPADLSTLDKNQVVQKIYKLQYNTPEQLSQIIQPLLTQDGYLSAEQNTGTLMIRDTVGTLLQLEQIIEQFDNPEADPDEQRIFVIDKGDPREIVDIINLILSNQTNTTGRTGITGGRNTNTRNTNTRTTGGRNTNTRTTGGRNTGFGF